MADEERLEDLMLRWEELLEAGQRATAEEICADAPGLLAEVRKRIDALEQMKWLSKYDGQTAHTRTNRLDVSGNGQPRVPSLVAGTEPMPGYRLVRFLGRGGFGEVWQAAGPDGVPVALKFIAVESRAAGVEQRAFEAIRELRHPHLLPVYGTWQIGGFYVLAMELADRTLLDRWREATAKGLVGIPREELLEYMRQPAEAIDFLNECGQNGQPGAGLQHRDIKPQNLLLVNGVVKVADFGLVRLLTQSCTSHTGNLTIAYAAPEFFYGKTSRHSDQYSLAVTYCHLRTGQTPFAGTPAEVLFKHLNQSPDLSQLPEDERPAVARALAKKPKDRWQSCQEFVQALTEPRPLRDTIRKGAHPMPSKKIRLTLIAGVVACLLLLTGLFLRWHQPSLIRVLSVESSSEPVRSIVSLTSWLNRDQELLAAQTGAGPMLWDGGSGELLDRLPGSPGACIASYPFQPWLVTGHEDGQVILWNYLTKDVVRKFEGHESPLGSIRSVAFSKDGHRLLTASCDETVRLWETNTGKSVHRLAGHSCVVGAVAFCPQENRAISGGWTDGQLFLWNLDDGTREKFAQHSAGIEAVCAFRSGDVSFVIAGGDHGELRLWNLETKKEVREFVGHTAVVKCLAVHPDRPFVLSGSGDGTARLWNWRTGKELWRSPEHPSAVESVRFAGGGIAAAAKGGIWIWKMPEAK